MKKPILLALIIFASCEPEKQESEKEKEPGITTEAEIAVDPEGKNPKNVLFGGMEISVAEIDGIYVHQGDILIPKNTKSPKIYKKGEPVKAAGRTSGLWEDNIIYYTIASDLVNPGRVDKAIAHWEEKTNLTFINETNGDGYLYFDQGSGCSSYIGKTGYKQRVNVGDWCTVGNIIHEIGHAVGLWHEQCRADRDDHITVHYENVQEGTEHNFYSYTEYSWPSKDYGNTLDFVSIMMYGPYSFTKNYEATITKKDGSLYDAQRDGLSDGDIDGINKMYPEDQEPEYVNGEIYYLYGATVLRMYDNWYHKHFRLGWKRVELRDGIWYWK